MIEALYTLLCTLKYPVFQQGSLPEDEPYPDSFFTFWNGDGYDGNHYDNDAASFVWSFDVNFYSNNRSLVLTELLEAKALLKENGWIVNGQGREVPSDEKSHTGRGMTVFYLEKNLGVQNDN